MTTLPNMPKRLFNMPLVLKRQKVPFTCFCCNTYKIEYDEDCMGFYWRWKRFGGSHSWCKFCKRCTQLHHDEIWHLYNIGP